MSRHRADKLSKIFYHKHNKAGQAPSAPKVGSTIANQYRSVRKKYQS